LGEEREVQLSFVGDVVDTLLGVEVRFAEAEDDLGDCLGVGLPSSFLSGGVGLGSSDFLAQEAKREAPTKRRARARAVLLIFFILLRVDYKDYGYGLHMEGAVVIARLGGLVVLLHLFA